MRGVLEHLLSEGVISEVLGRLQSGKEAEVFVVRCQGNVVVAKVYKDRAHRSFKNNSSYKEGRSVKNSRSQRAMDRGSKYGKAAAEEAWKSAEVDALYKLHAAEVRVPKPVMFFEGVLLMEMVLDADGNTAPRLIDTALTPEQANAGYHDMLTQLVRMLNCELIHGDLSPYNVLWAAEGPTVIDFPQIISASHNNSSEQFFLRDAENILGHLARIDPTLAARRSDASEIWRAYTHRDLTPDFRPTGKARPVSRGPAPVSRRQPDEPRVQYSSPQRGNAAPSRQPPARPFNDQRRGPRMPEVLLARPRAPGTTPLAPARPAGPPWPSSPQRPALQSSIRRAPPPASPQQGRPGPSQQGRPAPSQQGRPAPHGRPAPSAQHGRPAPQGRPQWNPPARPSDGSGEDSDRSSHRRRPRRRS